MKIEKISENKVRITLSIEELEKRKITLKDIEKNSSVAKELFMDLLEESNLDEDFIIDDSHLYIEASSDNNNLFVVTITRIDDMPDLRKYQLNQTKLKQISRKKNNTPKKPKFIKYTVDSNVYSFKNLDNILKLCEISKKEKLFFGKNSMYKYNTTYFLVFNKSSIKNPKFLKTYVFLSEFCENYYSYELFETVIKERAKLIIENNALQKLNKI